MTESYLSIGGPLRSRSRRVCRKERLTVTVAPQLIEAGQGGGRRGTRDLAHCVGQSRPGGAGRTAVRVVSSRALVAWHYSVLQRVVTALLINMPLAVPRCIVLVGATVACEYHGMSHPDHEPTFPVNADEPLEATLTFREQTDGRKVARLPGGKVVLIQLQYLDTVHDAERWRVRLSHRDTFSIAYPLERIFEPDTPLISPDLAERLRAELAARTATAAAVKPAAAPPELARPHETTAPAEAPRPPEPIQSPLAPIRILRPSDRVAIFVDGA